MASPVMPINPMMAKTEIPTGAELLLVVARIDPQKNQAQAIEVLRALAAERPRLHLALAGPVTDPAYARSLRRVAQGPGLAGRVHFVENLAPRSQDLVDAYHAADLVLLPSVHEPFGIVTLEAWAAQRAVLASRTGGIPFLVEDGRDGVLLDPADVGAWVRMTRNLLGDPLVRRVIAEAGHRKGARLAGISGCAPAAVPSPRPVSETAAIWVEPS